MRAIAARKTRDIPRAPPPPHPHSCQNPAAIFTEDTSRLSFIILPLLLLLQPPLHLTALSGSPAVSQCVQVDPAGPECVSAVWPVDTTSNWFSTVILLKRQPTVVKVCNLDSFATFTAHSRRSAWFCRRKLKHNVGSSIVRDKWSWFLSTRSQEVLVSPSFGGGVEGLVRGYLTRSVFFFFVASQPLCRVSCRHSNGNAEQAQTLIQKEKGGWVPAGLHHCLRIKALWSCNNRVIIDQVQLVHSRLSAINAKHTQLQPNSKDWIMFLHFYTELPNNSTVLIAPL